MPTSLTYMDVTSSLAVPLPAKEAALLGKRCLEIALFSA
jgi:hypothetical protein